MKQLIASPEDENVQYVLRNSEYFTIPLESDLSTITPQLKTGDIVYTSDTEIEWRWNGTEYIRMTPYYVAIQSKLGLINQTTAFEPFFIRETIPNVTTGNFQWTVPPGFTDFEVGVSYRHSINSTTVNFLCHVLKDGSELLFPNHIEPQDSGGAGEVFPTVSGGVLGPNANTGTDQFYLASGTEDLTGLTAGTTINFLLEFAGQSPNQEACIYEAKFWIRGIRNLNS